MKSNTNSSSIEPTSTDDTIRSTLVRPTTINSITNPQANPRYNTENISLSPSPLDTRPRFFQPGTLFDSNTYEQIFSSVYNNDDDDDDDDGDDGGDDDNDGSNKNLFDQQALYNERAQEIQQLSQIIVDDQPMDDNIAKNIIQQLQDILDTTKNMNNDNQVQSELQISSIISTEHPYPPINQTGRVEDHDRPYADYGHLDRQTIAEECQFNLQPISQQQTIRLHAKSFAITSWTNVSKELVIKEIKDEFGIENIQYICVGEEISELNHQRHLHIQIIFRKKIDRRKPFLDEITGTHCNYQVTHNDVAWNEYIKKGGNCTEFNEFISTSKLGPKQWPPSSPSSTSTSTVHDQPLVPQRTTTTARAQAEEKRQHEINTAREALKLAETSVNNAMDLIRHAMPVKFLHHCTWYLSTFKYVHLRAQQEVDRTVGIDKEYVWPLSFPDCTPQLREAINQWIRHHFSRAKRAKCLILIGPTGTGKTSFALSLPGRINYFKERWNLDEWNDYARYSVYDDVPWDEFKNLNYPNKKGLLTQNGKMNATDKYRGIQKINVRQPAIVLLNPEDAGSLTAPITEHSSIEQQQNAAYWKKRAFVYIMGPDEYFYRRIRTNTTAGNNDTPVSSNSSTRSNEARIGELDEFDQMIQRYQQKHST